MSFLIPEENGGEELDTPSSPACTPIYKKPSSTLNASYLNVRNISKLAIGGLQIVGKVNQE